MGTAGAVHPARLILASASPRRRDLLNQVGYTFAVEAAHLDESPRAGEEAADYVVRLAREKAEAIFERHRAEDATARPEDPLVVLGADTSVVCDGEIVGKPGDADDARRMLQMLSGRTHWVLTGVAAVARQGTISALDATEVTFSRIPEVELAFYCATSEPLDKAGAYGIQGYAARWIPRIDGCYFNVMGLPLARTVRLLEDAQRTWPSNRGGILPARSSC